MKLTAHDMSRLDSLLAARDEAGMRQFFADASGELRIAAWNYLMQCQSKNLDKMTLTSSSSATCGTRATIAWIASCTSSIMIETLTNARC